MKTTLKTILVWLVGGTLLLGASGSTVADSLLADAFNNLNVTTSDPGYFESQVRGSIMLGSGRMRFQSSTAARPLGINIVPPSLHVGCNGIDWHFGGLSWVNGENIERMLQAAGPAALMYVIKLAINALCEDCAEELGNVIKALQKAANSSMNSCQLGQNLAATALGFASDQYCKNGSAQIGESPNFSAARKLCNGESLFHLKDLGFIKTVKQQALALSGITSDLFGGLFSGSVNPLDMGIGAEKLENNRQQGLGNQSWEALKRAGIVMDPQDIASLNGIVSRPKGRAMYQQSIAFGELFMSAMGAYVRTAPDPGSQKNPKPQDVGATIKSGTTLLGILECGTNYFMGNNTDANGDPLPPKAERVVLDVCNSLFKGQGGGSPGTISASTVSILTCDPNYTNDLFSNETTGLFYFKCFSTVQPHVGKVNLGEWAARDYVQDTLANGTIGMAVARLYSISLKIQGISGPGVMTCSTSVSGAPGATGSTLCPEEIALLENAPFPLYKVVNLAALFPALRPMLFDSYGRILGLMMAQQYILNYLRSARQFASTQAVQGVAQLRLNQELDRQITKIKKGLRKALDRVSSQMQRATILTQQIMRLEQHLRNNIFDRQILGNQAFAQSVSTAAY